MSTNREISGSFALDVQSVEKLRLQAKKDPDQALKAASQQFEAMLLNMLLKSMRDATPQEGLLDSEQSKLYTAMLDQQWSQTLSSRGVGLAEVMVKQLSRLNNPHAAGEEGGTQPEMLPLEAPAAPAAQPLGGNAPADGREFVNRIWPHAVEAGRATGIPAHFMVGQAALESGWGKHEIRGADGAPSHNLFGIKAGRGWSGAVVESLTTEYVNGTPQKVVEKFRAYPSYGEAFRDYANLLRSNPRYAAVLENGKDAVGFARGLQQAGYATDPGYADKLTRIISGNILRDSLLG